MTSSAGSLRPTCAEKHGNQIAIFRLSSKRGGECILRSYSWCVYKRPHIHCLVSYKVLKHSCELQAPLQRESLFRSGVLSYRWLLCQTLTMNPVTQSYSLISRNYIELTPLAQPHDDKHIRLWQSFCSLGINWYNFGCLAFGIWAIIPLSVIQNKVHYGMY